MNKELPTKVKKGLWISVGSTIISELTSESGFDWLLFDLEHGCLTGAKLLENLQAAKGTHTHLIVRIPCMDKHLISRVLDWGADGIMLPMVSSASAADECLAAMHYAPHGSRGYSSSSRSFCYGLIKEKADETRKPLLIVQVENIKGIENITSIA